MKLDEIYRRLEAKGELREPKPGLLKSRSTDEVMVSDFEGALQRMIASEVNRQLAGRPEPADQKPLSARAQLMFERMHKAVDGVAKHELSVLPDNTAPPINMGTMAPVPTIPSGQFQASVLARDRKGMISHARFDTPDGKAVLAVVTQRDQNQRIERATFTVEA